MCFFAYIVLTTDVHSTEYTECCIHICFKRNDELFNGYCTKLGGICGKIKSVIINVRSLSQTQGNGAINRTLYFCSILLSEIL